MKKNRSLINSLLKNRFNILDLILCVMITAFITLTTINMLLENFNAKIIWTTHTVQKGENLTAIAIKHSDNYVLKIVNQIKLDNNMHESDVYVGQVLKIRQVRSDI